MGWWTSKPPQNIEEKSIEVELKIMMHCQKCVKDVKKVIFNFQGVDACTTDLGNNKVTVGGNFYLEGLLAKLEKKLGKKAEVLKVNEKDDNVEEEDDVIQEKDEIIEVGENIDDTPETSAKDGTKKCEIYIENLEINIGKVVSKFQGMKIEKDDVIQEKDEIEEKIDTPGTSETKLEINIPFLSEDLNVEIGKVISKFQGVKNFWVDEENKKVVIVGDFDKKKLERRVNRKINKIKKEKEIQEYRMKDDDERGMEKYWINKMEENKEIVEYERMNSDEEKVMKRYKMFSDENPNACSIS